MQPDLSRPDARVALVFGGTGAVGSAVLHDLARRGVRTVFTYWRSEERARALAAELGCDAMQVDLADPGGLQALFSRLEAEGLVPGVFIHCAAISRLLALEDIDLATWQTTLAINAQSAFLTCQWLARAMPASGDIVLVGALDRAQSLPLPAHFAASQGMLASMVMAMAHELGPRGIRINMVALGVLDGGLTRELDTRRRQNYQRFSALRRMGTAAEAARVIVWLALENHYIQGKVLPVNGGI